jgi:hypothetical protein
MRGQCEKRSTLSLQSTEAARTSDTGGFVRIEAERLALTAKPRAVRWASGSVPQALA